MSHVNRSQTIILQSDSVMGAEASTEGRLLQIHPVNLDSGLITLSNQSFIIGRENDSDLAIRERAVSRRHAKIENSGAGFSIVDLGSTNGTRINGKKIKSSPLKSGDRIRIGGRIFKFITTDRLEAQYHAAVYSMMTKDSLTQVWNKRYLLDMLRREIKRRDRTGRALSLLMIDVDFFKKVNDTYGHMVGDELLQQTARRLKQVLREEDLIARFGGEEFCIVLTETTIESARICAERCLHTIAAYPFKTTAGKIKCTISVGIASVKDSPLSTSELLKMADAQLYRAKAAGRNQYCG